MGGCPKPRSRAAALVAAIFPVLSHAACEPAASSASADWPGAGDSTSTIALAADGGVCLDCIRLTHRVTLGDTTGEGYVEWTRHIVRDSFGRYWLRQRDRLKVFDARGGYVGEVGRPGEGPMEFRRPRPVHTDSAGNVHVFDFQNVRESIIAPDFELVIEHSLPPHGGVQDIEPLPDGHRYLANMWVRSTASSGLPLHIVSGGQIVRSFGAQPPAERARNPFAALRSIAADREGHVFSARRFTYDIEVWTIGGRRVVGLSGPELNAHEVQWAPYNLDDNPLPNEILGLQTDGAGRLWVLIRRPRPDWRRHFEERVIPGGTVALQLKAGSVRDSAYTSRIDVIDPHRGAIVARLDRPGNLAGFVGRGLVFENVTLPDGTPRIAIWELELSEPGG